MELFLLVKLKVLDYLEGGVSRKDGTNFTVSELHTVSRSHSFKILKS